MVLFSNKIIHTLLFSVGNNVNNRLLNYFDVKSTNAQCHRIIEEWNHLGRLAHQRMNALEVSFMPIGASENSLQIMLIGVFKVSLCPSVASRLTFAHQSFWDLVYAHQCCRRLVYAHQCFRGLVYAHRFFK